MCTLVKKLSNICNYFLRLSGFPDFFWQSIFGRAMLTKQFNQLVSSRHREITTIQKVTPCENFLFREKSSRKRNSHQLRFIISVEKYNLTIHENLFAQTTITVLQFLTLGRILSHTWENSKMLNITSRYFRFFNNTPLAT